MNTKDSKKLFSLEGKVAVITGGAGFLGIRHAEVIAENGGIPVLLDIRDKSAVSQAAARIRHQYRSECIGLNADVTREKEIKKICRALEKKFKKIDILINNAANDPKQGSKKVSAGARLENFSLKTWDDDLSVGLTGAFICSKVFGGSMAKRGGGVIINIASDLGILAPDQRIYRRKGVPEDRQEVKPVSYSVVKSGIIGLTKYLATYWADKGIRANSISPGGVYSDQSKEFVSKLTKLIPMERMACADEYKGAILFLCSDASSYMTGANLVVDGGRSCW